MLRAKKVKRYVRLVADDPTVVRNRRNMKNVARVQFENATIIERGGCGSRKNESDVFNMTARRPDGWTDMLAPFPTRLVSRAPNRHSAYVHQFKFPFLHHPHFIRRFELF